MPRDKSLALKYFDDLSLKNSGKILDEQVLSLKNTIDENEEITSYNEFVYGGKMQMIRNLKAKCENCEIELNQLKKVRIESTKKINSLETSSIQMKREITQYQFGVVILGLLVIVLTYFKLSAFIRK
jgi:hypothetical protein